MKIIQYLRLIRFRYHISFLVVILGALIFAHGSLYLLLMPLLITYISFNIFLYGGLYTINDIADIEADKLHPVKKNRPLPSGRVSVASAFVFALSFIVIGLAASYFYFGEAIFLMYILFIIVNQIYTHLAKGIPYLEVLFNGLTYPLRLLLGILLVTKVVPWILLIAILLSACGIAFMRRTFEKRYPGWQARKALKYYNGAALTFIQLAMMVSIIALAIIDWPNYAIWYGVTIASYLFFLIGVYFPSRFTNYCHWLWLK